MRPSLGFALLLSGTYCLLSACGGAVRADAQDDDAGVHDGGLPKLSDSGVAADGPQKPNPPSNIFPAPHGPLPPVTYNGGRLLLNPKVVTVTFDGDAQRTLVEDFGDKITATAWWDAVSSEYCDASGKCIGHGTGGVYAHIATAPASNYTDSSQGGATSLQTYIDARIQDGTIPPPGVDTLYMIYMPSSTTISLDGSQSCKAFGAYHNAMSSTPPGGAAPVQFAYAIMPRCSNSKGELTFSASHEIIEAATDPYLAPNASSYDGFGSDSDAWDLVGGGGEVGDRCVDFTGMGQDSYQESGFLVQRSWSNAAAKASHDPCVPAPSPAQQPYFNLAPSVSDMLVMKVGQTKTLELTAFSDGPTPPFSIDVTEVSQFFGGSNVLDLSLDQISLQNGQKTTLTITLTSDPGQGGLAAFQVTSTLAQTAHTWSFIVSTM